MAKQMSIFKRATRWVGHALSSPAHLLTAAKRTTQGLPTGLARVPRLSAVPQLRSGGLAHAARTLLRGLTPEHITSIFDNADTNIADQIVLAAQMEEANDHLAGTLELRREAVLRLERQIDPGDPDDERSVAAAEAARTLVDRPWFAPFCEELLNAIWRQWAGAEMLYEQGAGRLWVPTGFRAVEPERFVFDADGNMLLAHDLAHVSKENGFAPEAGKFVIHSYRAVYGQPGRYAMVRDLAKLVYLANLDLTGWGQQVDQWGQPFTHFEYDPHAMDESQIQAVITNFMILAGQRVVATPTGVNVNLHDVPEQTPHEHFQDFCRRAMSKRALGQDTAQNALEGQETGATVQAEVRKEIRDKDALLLDATLNELLFAPLCAWNYGVDVAPPQIAHVVKEFRDPTQRGLVFETAQRIGLPIKLEQVYADLEIEQPAEGDALLVAPAAQSVPAAEAVDDVAFPKDAVRLLLSGQTTREVMANNLDTRRLVEMTGLPLSQDVKGQDADPWLPIIVPAGLQVTGDVQRDPEGDIVGGTAEPTAGMGGSFGAGMGGFDAFAPRAEQNVEPPRHQDTKVESRTATPLDGEAPVVGGERTVQDLGLNGAQITSLQSMLQAVTDGLQSPDAVQELISQAFPKMDPTVVARMINAAAGFTPRPKVPAVTPAALKRMALTHPTVCRRTADGYEVRPRAFFAAFAAERNDRQDTKTPRADGTARLARAFDGRWALVRKLLADDPQVRAADEDRKLAVALKRLPQILAQLTQETSDGLDDELHEVVLGAHALGRLETAARVAQKTNHQDTKGTKE